MNKLFGTDGIRSRAGDFPLEPRAILAIGQAIGECLGGPILIGQDPRTSSPWIAGLVKQGLDRAGLLYEDAGVLPTPAVAILTSRTRVRGGIMISASHNPFEDNGIKIFRPDGNKLEDGEEAGIELRVAELLDLHHDSTTPLLDPSPNGGESDRESPFASQYMAVLAERFPPGRWLEGLRIVTDCANGAMSKLAPALLESIGAEVSAIHARPSGKNINAGCGAVHPESLTDHVRSRGADLGVAFDGDGDRAIFVSSAGDLVNGDAVLFLMARRLKKDGHLRPPTVVGTSMTNYGLERALGREGIELVRVDVGDRYVHKEMVSGGTQLGGEPSGHIIFSDYGLSGDGLLTALKVCQAIVEEQSSLEDLARGWEAAPQLLRNLTVANKVPLDSVPTIAEKIREIATQLEGRGRIVVRCSGTEPLLRIMIESDSADTNNAYADELADVVEKNIPIL